ncbi:MAG: rhamnan synthesis F family protein [Spirochaetota bacterium]
MNRFDNVIISILHKLFYFRRTTIKMHKIFRERQFEKLCVFSHFDSSNTIHPYVVYYIKCLYELDFDIVFVSTSKELSEKEIGKLDKYIFSCLHRTNVGYDFGSWKVGLFSVAYKEYKEILFANDSVYGPLFDLRAVFAEMDSLKSDIWGITDSWSIQFHLMSYFIVYRENVIQSKIFDDLWKSIVFLPRFFKSFIIKKYEIGFSQIYLKHGYNLQAYCNYYELLDKVIESNEVECYTQRIKREKLTSTIYFWKPLITYMKSPFLKVEVLKKNVSEVDNYDVYHILKQYSRYDCELIMEHLKKLV